jgi:hypothetical protein
MKILILFFFLIDPNLLLGKWIIKFDGITFNVINSKAFNATPKEQQDQILEMGQLFFENAYYEFTQDTVYWTDVNPREKKVVLKKGKWLISGDTLKVFDYEKINSYNYLINLDRSSNEFDLVMIFSNNVLARGKITYSKSPESVLE